MKEKRVQFFEPRFSTIRRSPASHCGFTYIGLLLFIALMGIALAGTGVIWHTEVRREKERELLFVGDQYRRAIGLYYERSPGVKQFPKAIEDVLLDRRYPNTQRYLRRLYADPVGGTSEWGWVRGPEGGIMGVHSLSEGEPLKRAGFPLKYEVFEGKARYSDWQFLYVPAAPSNQVRRLPVPPPGKN
ncbi:MAG TPA: type II secretion system protein [Burkholderiales bacterium]|jgi:type II secretory pathway pseudopilin PulG|nr:type II secretion system protein [Burkholderiales bacterium]